MNHLQKLLTETALWFTWLWLLVLWRSHAERSWRGGRRCGISGGRGRWSGKGAGNEDVLLTLPSTLRNHIRHGDRKKLKYRRSKIFNINATNIKLNVALCPCCTEGIVSYLIIQQAGCGEVLSTSRQLNTDRQTDRPLSLRRDLAGCTCCCVCFVTLWTEGELRLLLLLLPRFVSCSFTATSYEHFQHVKM